jgi:hypothetical protein
MFNRAYTQVMTGAPLSIGEHLEDVIARGIVSPDVV